jgi:hypothetical protein
MLSIGKLGEETKKLYESSLSCDIINEGPDGANAANNNANLGDFKHMYISKYSYIYIYIYKCIIIHVYIYIYLLYIYFCFRFLLRTSSREGVQ